MFWLFGVVVVLAIDLGVGIVWCVLGMYWGGGKGIDWLVALLVSMGKVI